MELRQILRNAANNTGAMNDATRSGNVKVLLSLLGPAARGLLLQRGKEGPFTEMPASHRAHFDWGYHCDQPELQRLYSAAKKGQWDGETALEWSRTVDPHDPAVELLNERILPIAELGAYRRMSTREKEQQKKMLLAWLLSQFLHGEQGALFAACQVTEAVTWMDGKFYGSTQVVDEGRHVEVFHRYLTQKLERLYQINDNLYTIIDALMTDGRWDIKFLGMQIMIEGLALGAFGTIRANTSEPLLRELLKYVITDEARHVHFGVVALRDYYTKVLSPKELREREDWAFEMSLLMRNRFLAHEFYEEYYAHTMSRAAWDRLILQSQFMTFFRNTMFRRIVPNLKRINLLSDRVRPHYEALGLLAFEHEKAAPELTAADLLEG
ncbi:MAG: ferritin-like domain-containing protein [Myxococcales bacterium]